MTKECINVKNFKNLTRKGKNDMRNIQYLFSNYRWFIFIKLHFLYTPIQAARAQKVQSDKNDTSVVTESLILKQTGYFFRCVFETISSFLKTSTKKQRSGRIVWMLESTKCVKIQCFRSVTSVCVCSSFSAALEA